MFSKARKVVNKISKVRVPSDYNVSLLEKYLSISIPLIEPSFQIDCLKY